MNNIQKIQDLIQTALTNTDTDMQYMAARDLSEELGGFQQKNQQNEYESLKIICDIYKVYLTHLSSQYRDIQGNSIKCIQTLASNMRQGEIAYLVPLLLENSINQKQDIRENYQICLQEIVEKIPVKEQVLPSFIPKIIEQILKQKEKQQDLSKSKQIVHQEIQQCIQIQSELLKLVSSIMSRWPQLCKQNISELLLDNILNQNEPSIRKSSSICLGMLGLCLSTQDLNQIILKKLQDGLKQQRYDNAGFHKCLQINQSLNYLAKTAGKNFNSEVIQLIYSILWKTLSEQSEVDIDLTGQYTEIVEIQLQTIIYTLSNQYARQYDNQLINSVIGFIDFDPMGMAVLEDNEYDDEYYTEDTQDSTWRVRRCVIQVFQELLKLQPQLYKLLLGICFDAKDIIMNRLNEKNTEIRTAIIQFLITLVQTSAIVQIKHQNVDTMEIEELSLTKQRSVDQSMSIEELILKLLTRIQNIFNDATEQQILKSETTKLLLTITQYFIHHIQESERCLNTIVSISYNTLLGNQQQFINEQKITVLLVLKLLCKISNQQHYNTQLVKQLFNCLLHSVQQKYIRIVVEAYLTIDILLNSILSYYDIEQFQQELLALKQQVIEQIKIDNLDQEIKINLFKVSAKILKHFPQIMNNQDIEILATVSILRLQLEQLSQYVLLMIIQLPKLNDVSQIIGAIINQLNKQDKNKNLLHLAIISLLKQNNVKPDLVQQLLSNIKKITIDHYEIQIECLSVINKQTPIPDNLINEAIVVGCSQTKITSKVEEFFINLHQNNLIITYLHNMQLSKEQLYIAGQIYATLLKSDPNCVQILYQTLNQNRQLKLSALRSLHKTYKYEPSIQILCQLIVNKEDSDIAALTLGAAAQSIQQIQQLIAKNQNQYLYFQALKEYIEISGTQPDLIEYLLKVVVDTDKLIATIVGEIIGFLLTTAYLSIHQQVFSSLTHSNWSVRFACVYALKYSHQWNDKANYLLQFLKTEKDIQILTAIIKALSAVAGQVHFENFLENLSPCIRRFEERELNFGNFTEKRDDAKDLRSIAFDLLEISIEKQSLSTRLVVLEALERFEEDRFDDTRIPRIRILQKVSFINQPLLKEYGGLIAKYFTPIMKAINWQLSKQDANLDKELEKIRLIVDISSNLKGQSDIDKFYETQITKAVSDLLK